MKTRTVMAVIELETNAKISAVKFQLKLAMRQLERNTLCASKLVQLQCNVIQPTKRKRKK